MSATSFSNSKYRLLDLSMFAPASGDGITQLRIVNDCSALLRER
jgi:hypothetical protein